MTAGRGFVAVALVIFAGWDPLKAIAGAYLFSGPIALQLQLQAAGLGHLAATCSQAPALRRSCIVVLAVLSRRRVARRPGGAEHGLRGQPA